VRRLAPVVFFLLVAACASMKSDSGRGRANVEVPLPDLQIRQTSSVPSAAAQVTGGLPIQYALAVQNRAGQPITLKNVSIVSMGYGAYDVAQSSHPFKTVIQPAQTEVVQFWTAANISNPSLVGANGPVTLRVTAQFDSPLGQFQEVVVQQVNAGNGLEQ
jgi:hypothetical protein